MQVSSVMTSVRSQRGPNAVSNVANSADDNQIGRIASSQTFPVRGGVWGLDEPRGGWVGRTRSVVQAVQFGGLRAASSRH